MWVSQLPDDPVVAGWWAEAETARAAADRAAELRTAGERAEQARRLRRLRRRVERIDEQMVLAAGASDARRTLRRQGIPYERSAGGEIEYSRHVGRILSVR